MRRFLSLLAVVAAAFVVQLGASSYVVTPSTILADVTQDLQSAVDATPEGAHLQLGAGTYVAPDGGLVIKRGIEISGYGMGGQTVLNPYTYGQPAIRFAKGDTVTINGVYIHDLLIDGKVGGGNPSGTLSDSSGTAFGIEIDMSASQLVRNVNISSVTIQRMGNDGIRVQSADQGAGSSCCIGLRIQDCVLYGNWGRGLTFYGGATILNTSGNNIVWNLSEGALFQSVDVSSTGDYYEHNCTASDLTAASTGQARYRTGAFDIRRCSFEDFLAGAGTQTGLVLYSATGEVAGCRFTNPFTVPASTGAHRYSIFIDNSDSGMGHALTIGPNFFANYGASALSVDAPNGGGHATDALTVMPQKLGSNADTCIVYRAGAVPTWSKY